MFEEFTGIKISKILDGVPIWCGSFLNREEREVRKDLKAFSRSPWHRPPHRRDILREGRCGVRGTLTW
jgi:hypothetical protein